MKLRGILALLAALCILAAPAAAAGGDGTSTNPYQIETAAELQSIQNDLSAHYILMNDIDLTSVTWTPIGSTSAGFFGELDGNGHTISNLNAGLFSVLTSGATIKDLTLEDCHVETTGAQFGCLIGSIIMSESAHETANLHDISFVRCSVTGFSFIGVLCGFINTYSVVDIAGCTLINCDIESIGGYYSGILCGCCNDGSNAEITDCTVSNSHATINGNYGGIICGAVTSNSNMIITNCIVDSCIAESTAARVGIFSGAANSGSSTFATNCITENSIVKANGGYVAGFYGLSDGSGSIIGATDCTVKYCTVVTSGNYAGGIAGRVVPPATSVFNNCTVTDSTVLANAYAAGICPAYS